MADTKTEKCAHEHCGCMAAEGSKFCSPNCEAAKGMAAQGCECGHSGCKEAIAAA